MKLLLAGGGTGGHLFPAVAVAQLLLEQDPASSVLFVGTEHGLERTLLPKLGLPLLTVEMRGVVGRSWKEKMGLGPRLVKAMIQSRAILKNFQPDLVFGVGGYASVPVLLTAKVLGVPYLIHEQNAFAGLSNRLLGKWARSICLSLPASAAEFDSAKVRITGNPLRRGFDGLPPILPEDGELLIFGGSRGARAINEAVMAMLPLLKSWKNKPLIHHQTGQEDFDLVRRAYQDAGYQRARVVSFIDDMAQAYGAARLVICRSGATSLAEITVSGRPAILIPFPHAAADHQKANAQELVAAGAARMLEQKELTGERLASESHILLTDQEQLQRMANRSRELARPGAAARVLDECYRIVSAAVPQDGRERPIAKDA